MTSAPRTDAFVPTLVVATHDEKGAATLLTDPAVVHPDFGSIAGVVSMWHAPSAPVIPAEVGAVSTDGAFAAAGSVKFGKSWIAPGTEGQLDFTGMDIGVLRGGSDGRFHETDTLDLGVVLAGEAELSLEDGSATTLGPGSCFVLTGVQHYWRVLGDDAFEFAVVTVGATRAP